MQQVTLQFLYKKVFNFCTTYGAVNKLEQDLKKSKDHGFNTLNISKDGLRLIDAVHCIYDKRRTLFFLHEIETFISRGMHVIEAGIGTGILSFFAALKGATVSGLEINKKTLHLAKDIKFFLKKEKILPNNEPQLLLKNAITGSFSEKADVLINENLYTGMFFEKQVQINNNLLQYLKPNGIVIPQQMDSFIILANTQLPPQTKHKQLFVPQPERDVTFVVVPLSKPSKYDSLSFQHKMPLRTATDILIPIQKAGTINSVIIYSEVIMPSGVVIGRTDTIFLNSDIIIAVQPTIKVKKGDRIKLHISYAYGAKPQTMNIRMQLSHTLQ